MIDIRALTKQYAGGQRALVGVTLSVAAGKIVGFLGPNGAGKTTLIRILLGLLRPTAGSATILKRDTWSEGPLIRREVGYLPGELTFYGQLTCGATLRFLAAVRRRRCDTEIERLSRRFDLDLSRRVRNCSSGMRQKLGLVQALMHRPQLLVLDEPTNALDPLVRQSLFEELRRVRDEGRTVLFSSHTLSEVEDLCEQVAILRDGRLIEQARVKDLHERAVCRVSVKFSGPAAAPPEQLLVLERSEDSMTGAWKGELQPLLQWLAASPVRHLQISPPDLESLFLQYYDELEAGP